jgi:hypothetical protein
LFGQESILRIRPYDGTAGSFLNAQLAADTTTNHGILPNRVYVLQRGAPYLQNAVFQVKAGQTLRMRANDSAGVARPVIFLYPTGTGANPQNPPGNMLDLRGTVDFKNLVISGYFEPVDTNLNNLQGALINVPTAGAGATILIDSCILSNTNGNHIRTDGASAKIVITNSIFGNMGYLGRSNLGAGKGIDLRDASHDTVIVLNNTFVNWQDRVIRHYNATNPLAGTGPLRYFRFDHNTLVNGMSYHGLLSLGTLGPKVFIRDNLFMDAFALGNDTDGTRQVEFANSLEKDPYGGNRMNWVFSNPNDSTTWRISNNYYVVSDSGQAFYNQFASAGVTGEGAPLTYHINGKLGADSTNAFKKTTLTLPKIPKLMTTMMRWYRSPSGGNKLKNTPAPVWNISYDFDRKGWKYLHDTLNCAYSTGSVAYTGALGGFPVGDLNWFPSRKAQWLTNPVSDVPVVGELPNAFTLSQNYPNPFNPATTVTYSVPKEAQVRLEVFDVLGRKVVELVNEVKKAGEYHVSFDASRFGTGTYIYRMIAGGQTISKKMMLVK